MIYFIIACVLGLFMTWGVGANDLANVMSPSLGSKAFSTSRALLIAILFETAGAFFGGTDVTHTMRHGIIETNALPDNMTLIYGMLALLFSCMFWINLASYMGLPVSITHSTVGALVGFGAIILGINAIKWNEVARIAISWVSSPLFAGVASYILFISVQKLILGKEDPYASAKANLPYYFLLVGILLGHMILIKGLERINIDWVWGHDMLIDFSCGMLLFLIGHWYVKRFDVRKNNGRHEQFKGVEEMFGILLLMTTGAMVFAHGANDVSLAVAPLSIIFSLKNHPDSLSALPPAWITGFGVMGVILGLIFYGRRVIDTVGSGITALTPSRAFAATFAASSMVVTLTGLGIPVSATQTLVGAVLGVGLARGIGALNIVVIRNIFTSWVITIPVSSLLTVMCYLAIRFVLK